MRRVPIPGLRPGRTRLDTATSHHLLHVLRLRRGATVAVSDGAGAIGEAHLVDVDGVIALLDVGPLRVAPPIPARIVLLGVPKPALVEEALQLGTEAGASAFLLVTAERSPPGSPRDDRLAKIIANAAEQCGRADVPHVERLSLSDALARGEGARWLAEPGAPPLGGEVGAATVAIGPEGGWSPAEARQIQDAGYRPASIGEHILRAPTAVAVALGRLWS